jgi:DNA invertase Pin-like site-specific DNA recombinase
MRSKRTLPQTSPSPAPAPKTVAYLRVSTIDQDLDKFRSDILSYANDRGYVPVIFIEEKVSGKVPWTERKVKEALDTLQEGDRLIVPELSRLGRSMLEIMEILNHAVQKKVGVYSIKGDWELNGSIQSKVMAMVFAMAAEIERDLISARTREALRVRKAAGVKLGRPKGPGRSKLDEYRPEIEALLKNGSTKTFIAKRYGTTPANLHNWITKQQLG